MRLHLTRAELQAQEACAPALRFFDEICPSGVLSLPPPGATWDQGDWRLAEALARRALPVVWWHWLLNRFPVPETAPLCPRCGMACPDGTCSRCRMGEEMEARHCAPGCLFCGGTGVDRVEADGRFPDGSYLYRAVLCAHCGPGGAACAALDKAQREEAIRLARRAGATDRDLVASRLLIPRRGAPSLAPMLFPAGARLVPWSPPTVEVAPRRRRSQPVAEEVR